MQQQKVFVVTHHTWGQYAGRTINIANVTIDSVHTTQSRAEARVAELDAQRGGWGEFEEHGVLGTGEQEEAPTCPVCFKPFTDLTLHKLMAHGL